MYVRADTWQPAERRHQARAPFRGMIRFWRGRHLEEYQERKWADPFDERSPGSAFRLRRGGRRPLISDGDLCCHGEGDLS